MCTWGAAVDESLEVLRQMTWERLGRAGRVHLTYGE